MYLIKQVFFRVAVTLAISSLLQLDPGRVFLDFLGCIFWMRNQCKRQVLSAAFPIFVRTSKMVCLAVGSRGTAEPQP